MKKIFIRLSLGLIVLSVSCKKSDNSVLPPDGGDSTSVTPDVRGIITTDQHWTKDKTYRLR